ncbi:RHS repeat protein [Hymenobacter sp. P5252]|uniref:RHS repeat protein n=1 Tax=Hymenobacter terrestris TaxID=2748310 RepID=A0ABX2Q7E7_9BACT|nr:RHS repeat protein [Hymenobacter terrestris]
MFGSPTWTRQLLGNGEQLATHTTYSRDYPVATAADAPAAGLAALSARRILTAEVESQQWRYHGQDSVLVAGTLTHYGDNLQPRRKWRLATASPVSSGTFTNAQIQQQRFVQDGRYQELVSYEQYDPLGNLRQVRRVRDVPTTYLYGYQGTLPVAQIQHASADQVQTALTSLNLTIDALPTDAQQLRNVMTQLRQKLPQAQLTSMTHRPLVGVSSQTGPDNRTIFYEYDALGRLLRVRDEQGRILSENEYRYARP